MVPKAEVVAPSPVICPQQGLKGGGVGTVYQDRQMCRVRDFERQPRFRNRSPNHTLIFGGTIWFLSDEAREKGWPALANSSVTLAKMVQWEGVSTWEAARDRDRRISTPVSKPRPQGLCSDQLIPGEPLGKRDLAMRSHYSFCRKPTCEHRKQSSLGFGGGGGCVLRWSELNLISHLTSGLRENSVEFFSPRNCGYRGSPYPRQTDGHPRSFYHACVAAETQMAVHMGWVEFRGTRPWIDDMWATALRTS